jgi:hypothetical protein
LEEFLQTQIPAFPAVFTVSSIDHAVAQRRISVRYQQRIHRFFFHHLLSISLSLFLSFVLGSQSLAWPASFSFCAAIHSEPGLNNALNAWSSKGEWSGSCLIRGVPSHKNSPNW